MGKTLKVDQISRGNLLVRALWGVVYVFFFRLSPRPFFAWRRFLLRMFGAQLDSSALIYPSVRIWAPWNLTMLAGSCLGDYVDCYNVAHITLGRKATVSQYSYLCSATHDFDSKTHSLLTASITLEDFSWVTADVFVAPGVTISEGTVVLARSTVLKDLDPWLVYAGNPLRIIRTRDLCRADLEENK